MKTSKAEILSGLIQVRKEIIESIACLAESRQLEVFLGEWSLKDLLAHFCGWDNANREAIQELRSGKLPGFYAFIDRDWRTYNAQLVESFRNESFQALLAAVAVSQRALLDALVGLPESDFHQDYGVRYKGYKVTLGRLLEAEIEDERTHLGQVVSFLEPAERAEALFAADYNCSQSVLQTFAGRYSLAQVSAARLATGFGAGMAFQGMQCGAVSGALIVLGLQYGNADGGDQPAKALTYGLANEFILEFKRRHQTTNCRELLGIDLGKPGELERARENGVFDDVCPAFIRSAVEILSPMLDRKGLQGFVKS